MTITADTITSEPTTGPPAPPRHRPVEIAPDTFVIQATQGEGVAPVAVHLNAMVVRGPEPIVVDTGAPSEEYLEDLWSLVDPDDVRWVFLSHDDEDHYGNLEAVMEACPNAVLLTSWFQWERLGNLPTVAPDRMRWIETGGTFEANGRHYVAVRPPLYDSPTTRGLLDTATGVYWASDCFATPVPHGMADVAELDAEAWADGFAMFHQQLSPWLSLVDTDRYRAEVDRFSELDISTIASAHSPTIHGDRLPEAVEMLRRLPGVAPIPTPDQAMLDQIVAAAGGRP